MQGGASVFLSCLACDRRQDEALFSVLEWRNDGQQHFCGSDCGETTHLGCARNGVTRAGPHFGVQRSWGYEESNAAGAWRYGGAAAGVVGPRPVSITWRWPTLQIGQSGGRSSMTIASAADGGRSPRQCWTIFFRLRLERNPKCRIFTNPLGSTCRRNRRMNSTASSDISLI